MREQGGGGDVRAVNVGQGEVRDLRALLQAIGGDAGGYQRRGLAVEGGEHLGRCLSGHAGLEAVELLGEGSAVSLLGWCCHNRALLGDTVGGVSPGDSIWTVWSTIAATGLGSPVWWYHE